MSAAEPSASSPPAKTLLLPDFCAARAVLAVVLIVELVALIFTIARYAPQQSFWIDFAGCSLFLLWLGLVCTAVLCRARRWLGRMSVARAASVAMVLMLSAVSIVTELIYQLGQALSGGLRQPNSPFPLDHSDFVLRTLAIGFIVSALCLRYFYVSAEWKRSVEMEALARLRALQARIRPHFLFNSMNTIAALTRSAPERAEQAVEDLADLFRASLNEANAQILLRDELEIVRTHQRIEQLRLGHRLQVEWDIEGLPLRAEVPSLIIQPLLENAVYHGIEMLPEGGTVHINGRLQGQQIRIEVRNPIARGMHAEREGNRMALENIRQRLDLAWPGRAHVEARVEGAEFCARLVFPYAEAPLHEGA
jgi:two-component system, LytTR family, sensor histidine kinase AlgZ